MTHSHTGPPHAQAPARSAVDAAPPSPGLAARRVTATPAGVLAAQPEPDLTVAGEDPAPPELAQLAGSHAQSADAERRIAQLLGAAANHLISAGLDLASVRARLPRAGDCSELEHATNNLDAALADIRGVAVRIAVGTQHVGPEAEQEE